MSPEQEKFLHALLYNSDGELDRALKVSAFTILAAEELRQAVEQKALFFFGLGDSPILPIAELPKGLNGLRSKRSSERLKAASRWFVTLDAFTQEDADLVRIAMEQRNEIAHELQQRLMRLNRSEFSETIPFTMICLTHKINLWWIKNFEAALAPEDWPDFDDENLALVETVGASLTRNLFWAAFPEFRDTFSELCD